MINIGVVTNKFTTLSRLVSVEKRRIALFSYTAIKGNIGEACGRLTSDGPNSHTWLISKDRLRSRIPKNSARCIRLNVAGSSSAKSSSYSAKRRTSANLS